MSQYPNPPHIDPRKRALSSLQVSEDADYDIYLHRDHSPDERLQTFLVTLTKGQQFVVLAPSVEDAISQAQCGDDETVCSIIHYSFRIRGWSNRKF